MIQRTQTLFLALAVASLIGFLFAYLSWATAAEARPANLWTPYVVVVFCGLSALVSLAAVFLYRDRSLQRRLVAFAQWMVVLGFGAMIAGIILSEGWEIAGIVLAAGAMDPGFLLTIVLPPAAYVFLRIARRRIEKDIELVESMDRLR